MKLLVVMGLRTLAHLDAKETMYEQIDRDAIRAEGRFPGKHLEAIAGGFALGILSSHSVVRIERVVDHLGMVPHVSGGSSDLVGAPGP